MLGAYSSLIDRSLYNTTSTLTCTPIPTLNKKMPSSSNNSAVAHHAIMALTFVFLAATMNDVWVAVLGALVTYPSWRMLFMTVLCFVSALVCYRPEVAELLLKLYRVIMLPV